MNELSVTDVVETVLSLDNGINPGVEASQVGDLALNLRLVEGGSGSEEVSSESIVGVVEDSVLVVAVGSGGVLAEELDLPVALRSLLDNHLGGITGLDGEDGELYAEGGSRELVVSAEEGLEADEWEVAELASDLGEHDGV